MCYMLFGMCIRPLTTRVANHCDFYRDEIAMYFEPADMMCPQQRAIAMDSLLIYEWLSGTIQDLCSFSSLRSAKTFDDIMIDQNGAARDTIFNPELVVSILQTSFSSMNHLYPLCFNEDLTAARKFQMDANGRKFENRVATWLNWNFAVG